MIGLRKKVIWPIRSLARRIMIQVSLVGGLPRRRHNLPGSLIISLTSYPPRFSTLYGTLIRLLTQSTKPDRVILWIAEQDMTQLPARVHGLAKRGLEIRPTKDVGSYKKIIPTLAAFPDAFIVTADDDVNYRADWLADLLKDWDHENTQIVFHRGHEIVMDVTDVPMPYAQWKFRINGPRESSTILPTGAGGVFYPPGVLAAQVGDETSFMALCPRGDDLWLYWMGRLAGATYKKTAVNDDIVTAPDSQDVALWHENVTGGVNDVYIANLIQRYGWPQ